jgi:hypothetical protein
MKANDGAIALNELKLVDQIEVAIKKQIERRGKKAFMLARQWDSVKAAAANIVKEFSKGYKPSIPGAGIGEWVNSDDTRKPSLFMATQLFGLNIIKCPPYAFPRDNADFESCVKLWQARSATDPVADTAWLAASGKEWKAIMEQWDNLLELYQASSWAMLNRKLNLIAAAK